MEITPQKPAGLDFKIDSGVNCVFLKYSGNLNFVQFVAARRFVFQFPHFSQKLNRYIDLTETCIELDSRNLEKLSRIVRNHLDSSPQAIEGFKSIVIVKDKLTHGVFRMLHSMIGVDNIQLRIVDATAASTDTDNFRYLNLPRNYTLPRFLQSTALSSIDT